MTSPDCTCHMLVRALPWRHALDCAFRLAEEEKEWPFAERPPPPAPAARPLDTDEGKDLRKISELFGSSAVVLPDGTVQCGRDSFWNDDTCEIKRR